MHEPSNLRKTFSMYKIIRLFGSIIICLFIITIIILLCKFFFFLSFTCVYTYVIIVNKLF